MRHLVFLLLLPAASACFLDLLGICGGASKIAEELDKLPEKAAEAAEQVLDQLFNKDLPPFVDKITAAAEEMLDRGEQDYEKAVNATRDALTQLARSVVSDCEELAKDVTKDVEDIVSKVLSGTVKAVEQITADISKSVNELIDRLEMIGQTIFCAASGYIDVFEKQFSSYFEKQDCECVQQMLQANPGLKQDCSCTSCFHIGGLYPRCRCNPWELKFGPGWFNRGKYQFSKCHLYKPIDWEKWTVQQIENQLSIVQEMALSFRCLEDMQPGSTLNRDYFSDEFVNITHTLLVLRHADQRRQTKPPQTSLPDNSKRGHFSLAQLLSATDSCSGKTLPMCVTQALEELETMQQQMQQQDLKFMQASRQVQASLTALSGNVTANMSALQSQQQRDTAELNAEISRNNAAILQNKQDVSGLQSKVDGLSVGLCNCQQWDANSAVPDGYLVHGFSGYCSPDGCKDDYQSLGGGEGDDGIYVCQPCLNGDGSDTLLEKQMTSCKVNTQPLVEENEA